MTRKHLSVALLALVALALNACIGRREVVVLPTPAAAVTPAPTDTAAPTDTIPPADTAPAPATAPATSAPTAAPSPTAAPPTATSAPPSPTPTADPGPPPIAATRIEFAPGATVAQLNDALAAGGDANTYVLRVLAGQTVTVGVFASPPAVSDIAIRDGAGGQIAIGTDMTGASGAVAADGDVTIDISSQPGAPAVSYILTVSVPPQSSDVPRRIEFGSGQTSVTVNGRIRAGLDNRYVLRAAAGQTLVTTLSGHPVNTVEISVGDAGGAVLNMSTDPSTMVTTLPASGDYIINLRTQSPTEVTYVLKLVIPPAEPPEPARILFAPGTTAATVSGALDFGGDVDTWVLGAAAGQFLSIGVGPDQSGWMNLFVYDPAGGLLTYGSDLSGVAGRLPDDGDYTIVVSSIQAAPPLGYSMTVSVADDPRPQEPTRIEFAPGQTSATLSGQLAADAPVEYIIGMEAGQTLLTHLDDEPRGNVEIAVLDTAATLYNIGRSPTQLGTRIPASGDYLIRLSAAGPTPVNYTLEVIAPPLPGPDEIRAIIPAGGTGITVSGHLGSGGDVDTWVVGGTAGQVLHLRPTADQPGRIRVYVYNAALDIIALGPDAAAISAPLVATGDYRVVVAGDATPGAVSYSLVLEIP